MDFVYQTPSTMATTPFTPTFGRGVSPKGGHLVELLKFVLSLIGGKCRAQREKRGFLMTTTRSSKELKQIRQDLRKNMTQAEKKLWYRINRKQIGGFKFRRQHPFRKRFILDFYCPKVGLAIEVDGCIHESQKEHDEIRQSEIEATGVKIIRFKNMEIENNIDKVVKIILIELRKRN